MLSVPYELGWTERSMSLDTELCLLWQAPAGSALSADIRRVRASLLAEHSGQPDADLAELDGLCGRVQQAMAQGTSRLRVCHLEPANVNVLKQAIFDPSGPTALASFQEEVP